MDDVEKLALSAVVISWGTASWSVRVLPAPCSPAASCSSPLVKQQGITVPRYRG